MLIDYFVVVYKPVLSYNKGDIYVLFTLWLRLKR